MRPSNQVRRMHASQAHIGSGDQRLCPDKALPKAERLVYVGPVDQIVTLEIGDRLRDPQHPVTSARGECAPQVGAAEHRLGAVFEPNPRLDESGVQLTVAARRRPLETTPLALARLGDKLA